MLLPRLNPFLYQMRKEYEYKKYRTHQHEGGKESQIAQCRCIQWNQTGERAHRGDVSYQQRCNHLLKHLPRGSAMVGMSDEVQRVVHCNSYDDGAYPQHNQRDVASHDGYKAHGKQPPEAYRHAYQQQVPHLPERIHQQQQYQRYGNRDGPPAVLLYLRRITHGNHGRSRDGNVNIGNCQFCLPDDIVNECCQHVVVRRLHRTVWRRQHGDGIFSAGGEDIPVVHFEGHRCLSGLQPVGHPAEQSQWVVTDARCEKSRCRHHHHLHVGCQLRVRKVGSCQHAIHTHIVGIG